MKGTSGIVSPKRNAASLSRIGSPANEKMRVKIKGAEKGAARADQSYYDDS
jgi:hypothetical protein